jgi:hypothetical protein
VFRVEKPLPSKIMLSMTVVADNKKRVVLPSAQPGDQFDVELAEGKVVLTRIGAARPKVQYRRKNGLLLARTDEKITWEQTRKALDEFP